MRNLLIGFILCGLVSLTLASCTAPKPTTDEETGQAIDIEEETIEPEDEFEESVEEETGKASELDEDTLNPESQLEEKKDEYTETEEE